METGSLGCLVTVLQHPEGMVLDLQLENLVGFLKVRPRSFGEICPPLEDPLVCDPCLSRFREVACRVNSVLWGSSCDREDVLRAILPSDQDGDPCPPPGALVTQTHRLTTCPPVEKLEGRSPVTWGPSPTPPHPPGLLHPCHRPSPPPPSHCSRSKGGMRGAQSP